jgi:sugar (pentulose or hexulose) kinase
MKDPAEQALVLAIDCGTQSTRALLFNLQGELVLKSQVPISPYESVQPGWAEQDVNYYWHALCLACQQLWDQAASNKVTIKKSSIKAVSLSCHRGTIVNLDKKGNALRPAIVWLDQRQADQLPSLGLWNILFRTLRLHDVVHYFQTQAELNWIKQHQPEIWEQTHKCVLLSGYHCYRLTGSFIDSTASQVGYIPFNYRRQQWCGKRDWKWKALSVNREMLPDLVKPGEKIGSISKQASTETGIPIGLPLIAAGADKACELLGAGGLAPGVGSLSYGTGASFNLNHHRYIETIPSMPPYPAAIPGKYNMEVLVSRGFWMVNWFKREFAHREQQLAAQQGVPTEQLLEQLLTSVPPGSMGLILQPYWSPGTREPGPLAKGAIIGFGDIHTRAHIYRSIIEGLVYALREGKERVEKRSGLTVNTLRVSGGGSQSDEVMQITADIFNVPAERAHTYETSGLGAAINAAVGVGLYPNYEKATKAMVHKGKCFEPNKNNAAIYDRLYNEIYKNMYSRLDSLYQSIKNIIGYPH